MERVRLGFGKWLKNGMSRVQDGNDSMKSREHAGSGLWAIRAEVEARSGSRLALEWW